jgi:hypothetical protein
VTRTLVIFITTLFLTSISSAVGRSQVVGPASTAPAGPVFGGISLAISGAPSYCYGQPVRIVLEIKNGSTQPAVLLTPYVAYGYKYTVIDLATNRLILERVPHRSGDDVWGGFNQHIPAGDSYTTHLRLDDIVFLDHPGKYSVTLSTRSIKNRTTEKDLGVTSNSIVLQILKC